MLEYAEENAAAAGSDVPDVPVSVLSPGGRTVAERTPLEANQLK
jgi:hypothetical protein